MFGYIAANIDEMKLKDYRAYHAVYCGICQDLKENHGQVSRATLTYDMTFLALLLTGLYEPEEKNGTYACAARPLTRHPAVRSAATAYAADMNVLISYFDLLDDWEDERKVLPLVTAAWMKRDVRALAEKYPDKIRAIRRYLRVLRECEKSHSDNLDLASGETGELMRTLYQWKDDRWAKTLGDMGFHIGKFIYLMDAFEDVEKDRATGNYNPWLPMAGEPDFKERVMEILMLEAAQCCRSFEKLPIVEYVDILRNILYSGIWTMSGDKGKHRHPMGRIDRC